MAKTTTTKATFTEKLNGKTVEQCAARFRTLAAKADGFIMNGAFIIAAATGITIPAWNNCGEVTIENAVSEKDFAIMVDRDYKTVNRWKNAAAAVIEHGYFADFASGLIAFNYDKILQVFPHWEVFKDDDIYSVFSLSLSAIKAKIHAAEATAAAEEAASETEEETAEAEAETEATAEEAAEMATITYDGKEYSVPKADLLALLAKAELI